MNAPQLTIDLINALNRSLELIQNHKASFVPRSEIDACYASAGVSVVSAIEAIALQFAKDTDE